MATQQVFIALQCCQCSTMQVKQQKRSSNKWICAVCNQKQSVRKVFARGYLARDVRGFVQRFNMSTMMAGEPGSRGPAQIGADLGALMSPPVPSSGNAGYPPPRRTDWSEFLDPDEQESNADASNEAIPGHPEVVTEMPAEKFRVSFSKRSPNLGNSGVRSNGAFKPTFPKRKQKQKQSPQPQPRHGDAIVTESGGWKNSRVAEKGSSKWGEYLQEEADDGPGGVDSLDPYVRWVGDGDGDGHGRQNDVTFEEEVHPDFV